MAKIDIYSGFLGAGKTTLIKKLINEAYCGEKVVLIENEFGEIGIDGGFLKDAGIEITEMNSGCICCSLVGDFTSALGKVIEEYHPDRIIIEPSGVGKLSDIIRAVEKLDSDEAYLNSYTTVADAGKCKMYMKNFGEFYNDQVSSASAIVLSHTDKASEKKVEEAVALIRQHNDDAVIITTPLDLLNGKDILAAIERKNTLEDDIVALEEDHKKHHHRHHDHHHEHDEHCECGCHDHDHHHEHDEHCECGCHDHDHHHEHDEHCECGCHDHDHHHEHDEHCECGCHDHDHHHEHDEHCECGCHDHDHHHEHDEHCECGCHGHHGHHADEVFTSVGFETTKKFSIDGVKAILESFDECTEYGMILRAKGIVECECGKWIHFDYVPGEPDVRCGSANVIGRICVIGSGIDKEKIREIFGV